MALLRLLMPRKLAFISAVSLGGYFMLKSRPIAQNQRENRAGDYSVSVDRSGGGI